MVLGSSFIWAVDRKETILLVTCFKGKRNSEKDPLGTCQSNLVQYKYSPVKTGYVWGLDKNDFEEGSKG
jgi:hypothetical protein